jgi:ATP-dependent DNA helicase UvrD/PcrA
VFDRSLYLRAAEDLRPNAGQWDAYNSKGHCVVLAGPGSGKTKTLTIKLARMLAEDVEEPRGIACVTYNTECARELEQRLAALSVEPGRRVFVGTVHSFSLTQIVLPYAKVAKLGLPDGFTVATDYQQRGALETAFKRAIGGPENPQDWKLPMNRHRRSILNRDSKAWKEKDPDLSRLVEEYEKELRVQGVIDFEDMPLLAMRALRDNEWLRKAILAKYPILAVDEYQDLGRPLHRMVLGLCFSAGIRLFAVGDGDQSIYGFTGAYPELLKELAEREDVQEVRLKLNYRCGSRIVTASEYALGEERGYAAPDDAEEGTIYFHPRDGSYDDHAAFLFGELLPVVMKRIPDLMPGKIAVLYPEAWLGDYVAEAAQEHGFGTIRSDKNALYSRSSPLMRWLERCAVWCCDGWKSGKPRFARIIAEGAHIFAETLPTQEARVAFRRNLLKLLWDRRDGTASLHDWLCGLRKELVAPLIDGSRTLAEEGEVLDAFIDRTGPGGDVSEMTLGLFAGFGEGNDRINLSTLHSAKGREFKVVFMFGMDEGRIPRKKADAIGIKEARRLFYVGFTRTESELHLIFSANNPSRFVSEVEQRLAE